jgi:beta-glucanase (GH16 family)
VAPPQPDANVPLDATRAPIDASDDAFDAAGTTETSPPLDAGGSDANAIPESGPVGDGSLAGWTITWRDEFDGPAGTTFDATKWRAKVGLNGANGELEYYTARTQNVALDGNGNLVITALKESYMGAGYTSARLETGGKFEQAYGRFETRIKVPVGQGMWPAFWILGANIGQVGWPSCGEVDIMEQAGAKSPSTNNGSMHGPGYSGNMPIHSSYKLPTGTFGTDFHVFALEWETNVLRFYVDDNLYATHTPADLPAGTRWVYDHPFNIILNLAIGGGYPGNPDATTVFPQPMLVDYVRVYKR